MPRRKGLKPPVLSSHDVFITGLDPRHDGLRIAHLSDVHVGLTPRDHVRAAVELANDASADVTVLTGDYVCWSRQEIPLMEEQLGGLTAARVIVTLGNHDYFTSAKRIGEAMIRNGYDLLKNASTTVDVGGAPLHVVGIDDPVTRHHDIDAAYRGVPATATTVVLCHCPEQADNLAERGADLILSGHMHGGQIYLRGITDRIIKRMGRRYRSGFYDVAGDRRPVERAPDRGSRLYVTSGVGFSGVRVRSGDGTTAEVALFTLRRAADAAAAA